MVVDHRRYRTMINQTSADSEYPGRKLYAWGPRAGRRETGGRRPEAGVSVHGKSGTPRQRTAEYRTRNRRMPRERGLERNSRHFAVLSSLFDIRRFISSPRQIRLNGYPPGDLSVLHAFTDRSFRQRSVRPIGRGGGAGGDCPTTGPTTEPSTTGRRVGQP
jgi:hypothetical protein